MDAKRFGITASAVLIGVVAGVTLSVHLSARSVIVKQLSQLISVQRSIDQRLMSLQASQTALIREMKTQITKAMQNAQRAAQPRGEQAPGNQEDYSRIYKIPLAHSPVKGNKNAPVTIVEFIDLECPFSARFHPVMDELLKAYPDQVRLIMKHYPLDFHKQARPAAKAVLAAGEQGKYWEMVDLVLKNNRQLSEEKFKELAGILKLDQARFMDDFKKKSGQWDKYIKEDRDLGAEVDVRGTPTYFINGRKTRARDFKKYKEEIDKILKK